MIETKIIVRNKVGLHARPAALFVQTANKFSSSVKVKNLSSNGDFVDAKSIIMVLTLGVLKDHEVVIQTDGPDEEVATNALRKLIDSDFSETQTVLS